jgi:hypothetical protein
VCAHTNVAVDNLVDGLRNHGVNVLRFGNAARVPLDLQDQTFEAKLEAHPLWHRMDKLRNDKARIADELASGKLSPGQREMRNKQSGAINGKMFVMKKRLHHEVLADADVICSTCLSATSRILDVIDFPFVFLDEASMATEPLSLVPLTKGAGQVAIIGDHKQLPPVIVSETGQAGGLATSLFERLIHEKRRYDSWTKLTLQTSPPSCSTLNTACIRPSPSSRQRPSTTLRLRTGQSWRTAACDPASSRHRQPF